MPTCLFSTLCVHNTGIPNLDDNYILQPGSFNNNSFYFGQTTNNVIFFNAEGYWCLSDYIDGPCYLSGRFPCTSNCPDFCEDYFIRGACPPPEPPPVNPCDIIDFEAIFDCEVEITPTPTPTNTSTPTTTPTPTSTSLCPLFVDATILSYTPTPTVTPSFTPTQSRQITRDCGFMGDVTFTTINSTIDCPFSLEFQDCYNGAKFYTSVSVDRPEGGSLEQFMIYQANVDGVRRCISYVGVNANIIGANTISFISNLIGYSNLGQCSICLEVLTPTPTPTPTITPTITLTRTVTSSSNLPLPPPPPPASNTPTPTKSKPVLFYTYQKCNSIIRVCQPVEAMPGQIPAFQVNPDTGFLIPPNATIFRTGNSGDFPNTCWILVGISSSCNTSNPNYNYTIYDSNAFPSILNSLFYSCNSCQNNSPTQPPTNTPTPTKTPTPTRAPQVQACKPHTVRWSVYEGICGVCTYPGVQPIFPFPPEATWYSLSDTLVVGSQVYLNSTCTTPVPSFTYFKAISSGGVVSQTFVTFGSGIISTYPCTICD